MLLARGANPNDFWSSRSQISGQTLLDFTVFQDDYPACQISFYDPKATPDEHNIIFDVGMRGRVAMFEELLKRGAKADTARTGSGAI